MDWLKAVIEWIKSSVPLVVAIWIASGFFVLTPLSNVVAKYQPWPLIIFVVSTAYLTVLGTAATGKKITAVVNRKRAEHRSEQRRVNSLYQLSGDEKAVLRLFIGNNRRTIPMSRLSSEMTSTANDLVRRRILRSHADWFSTQDRAFTVEDWHWDYLNQKPDVLD